MLRGWDSVTSKFRRRKISPRPRNFDFACWQNIKIPFESQRECLNGIRSSSAIKQKMKKPSDEDLFIFRGCGGGIRTHDLQVLTVCCHYWQCRTIPSSLPTLDETGEGCFHYSLWTLSQVKRASLLIALHLLQDNRVSGSFGSFSISHYCERSQFNYEPDELPLLYPAISII